MTADYLLPLRARGAAEGFVVKLINTEGMAFIGPGSEWFWTAVSGIVLAVTFIAIYRQLRLQSSQSAIEQLDTFESEWASERMVLYKLEILVALRDGASPTDLPTTWVRIAMFWERVGALVHAGHIDRRLLWNGSGSAAIVWWTTLAAKIRESRKEGGGQTAMEHFEWLASVMEDLDRQAGALVPYDEAAMAARIPAGIAGFERQLRVEQALRTVIIASSATTPGPATDG
jgi:hypothetical protein